MPKPDPSTQRRFPHPFRRVPVLVSLLAFGCVAILDLIAEAAGWRQAALVFRILAMPLLICVLVTARSIGDRAVRLVVVALFFCWLGDTVGGADPLIKLGFFLAAHIFFIIAFWPSRRSSMLYRRWLVGYGILLIIMAALLVGRAGDLAVPMIVYGCAVVFMAVLASGLGRTAMIGGSIFALSDSLLGILWFYRPAAVGLMDFSIMLTYLLAQALLVWAVIGRVDRRCPGATSRV